MLISVCSPSRHRHLTSPPQFPLCTLNELNNIDCIGLFDSHSLFEDIVADPGSFLNGTAPFNVTGAVHSCVFVEGESTSDAGVCTTVNGTDRDSYVW